MSAAAPQIFYNPPWPYPLYKSLNFLLNYGKSIKPDDRTNILNEEAFDLLSKTAMSIFREPAVNDREIALSLGKDLLQTAAEEHHYEILLNGAHTFRYNFDPDDRFTRTADDKKKPESNENLQQAQLDLEKPPELQTIEQLFNFLTTNSCPIDIPHFLLILLGIQQSNASDIIITLKSLFLDKVEDDYKSYINLITPFINKTIFNIQCEQCDPSPSSSTNEQQPQQRDEQPQQKSICLTIRTTLKYYLNIMTNEGTKKISFPFELTDIVYVLNLTNIVTEKPGPPGLTLERPAVNELFHVFGDCYDIIKKVPNILNSRNEIDYNVFKTALEKKIKYRTEDRDKYFMEIKLASKALIGGKRQKTRIRRVSKKKYIHTRDFDDNEVKEKANKISEYAHFNYKIEHSK